MSKRILAVDDNEDLLQLLAEILGDEGYDVTMCHRSREAYAVAKAVRPDAVLLDILMPGMTGWEVLNLFLLDRDLRKVPVLLMTAAASDAHRRLAKLEIYDVSILEKPFDFDRLTKRVEAALGQPAECEVLYDQITTLITPLTRPEGSSR